MQAAPEVKRKRTASAVTQSDGHIKKQKLANVRKIPVPPHRLVKILITFKNLIK